MRKHFWTKVVAATLCCAMTLPTFCACNKEVTLENEGIVNFTEPQQGEEIVVLTIKDYGDVKIKLFPEETSKGVENFKKLVESGFYDELIFHRVVDGFVIQGGDPKGNGTGGEDAWGGNGFAQTLSGNLQHYVGAVAYAIGGDKLNKSQFYIVTGEEINEDYMKLMESTYGKAFSDTVKKMYYQFGGQPYLDGGYEIFGQVFDGLEHCLAIQKVQVNGDSKPLSAIVIEKAVVTEYDGSGVNWLNSKGEPQSVAAKKAE